ncbi:hypothetical protein [Streptomyces brasiliensis]|uniref:hypothetical protein n=1 Tax=Streptomyces brasiliensis TaxID=1954 RepID=UPI0016701104|nr:hypothetical protein [Streptomyces brasiliensis]
MNTPPRIRTSRPCASGAHAPCRTFSSSFIRVASRSRARVSSCAVTGPAGAAAAVTRKIVRCTPVNASRSSNAITDGIPHLHDDISRRLGCP